MNLGELIEKCQFRTGFSDSAYRPRWLAFINQAVREFARRQPWQGLEDTFTAKTDGTQYLVMPHYVDTVVSLLNITDSLPVERGGDWETRSPAIYAQGTAGRPFEYDNAGDVPVTTDPTGYLWFRSTSVSDTQTVFVTGLVANSGASGAVERTIKNVSVAATGTSPVTLSSLFAKILSISKSTDTNGDFYFFDAGASNAHISFMAAGETEAAFRRLKLLFKPDAQRSLQIRFRYRIPKLNDNSQSPPPAVKSDYIVEQAIVYHWAEQEQFSKSQAAAQSAQRVLESESNKDNNFAEPFNRITPALPGYSDASDDFFRQY